MNQEVNVIRHNLGLNQEAVRLLDRLGDNPLESPIDAFDQNRAPVFRAKNHVVLARKDDVAVQSIIYRGSDSDARYNSQVGRLFSPCLKAGGSARV
jgi:hypothetical protein